MRGRCAAAPTKWRARPMRHVRRGNSFDDRDDRRQDKNRCAGREIPAAGDDCLTEGAIRLVGIAWRGSVVMCGNGMRRLGSDAERQTGIAAADQRHMHVGLYDQGLQDERQAQADGKRDVTGDMPTAVSGSLQRCDPHPQGIALPERREQTGGYRCGGCTIWQSWSCTASAEPHSPAAIFPAAFAVTVWGRQAGLLGPALLFFVLLALRALQTVVGGGMMPAAQAFVADTTCPEKRAGGMGMMGAAFGFGTILGGALAWRLGGSDAVAAFVIVSAVGLAALALLWWKVPETRDRPAASKMAARLPLGRLWPCLAMTLLGLTIYSMLQQVTALRMQDAFGVSPQDSIARAGMTMMLTMAAMIATQGLVVRRLRWLPRILLLTGVGIGLAALALGMLAPSVVWLIAGTVGLGAGLGLLLPGNLAVLSLRAGASHQGRAAGVNGLAQGLGMAIGPLAGAALNHYGPMLPYALCFALMAMIGLVAAFALGKTAFVH